MKLYITTPINARKEPTMQRKMVEALRRIKTLTGLIAANKQFNGYETISTFDLPHDDDYNEASAVGKCVTAVMECDAVYLDHGWEASKGCNIEYQTAKIIRQTNL